MSATSGIDALFFSHISDRILSLLFDNDPLTAAYLQTVSRDWHTKIRTRLLTHVWISRESVFSGHGYHSALFSIGTIPLRPAPSLQFTLQLTGEDHPEAHPLVRAVCRTAQVIACRRLGSLSLLPEASPQMIRLGPLCDDHLQGRAPTCEALVVFKTITHQYRRLVEHNAGKKLVVHTKGSDFDLCHLFCTNDLPKRLINVAVFYPFRPRRTAKGVAVYNELMQDLLTTIEDRLGPRAYNRTLTLISPDQTSPHDRHLQDTEPSWAELRSMLQDQAPQVLDHIEFLSNDEYRERVGEKAYSLHAHWESEERADKAWCGAGDTIGIVNWSDHVRLEATVFSSSAL